MERMENKNKYFPMYLPPIFRSSPPPLSWLIPPFLLKYFNPLSIVTIFQNLKLPIWDGQGLQTMCFTYIAGVNLGIYNL